ncbi:PDCD2/Programmed cell death protein 2 [Blumeria hordei DH14]|uniref:PDCD2/Programmed cell death protein 2 n=1 Tax=Blumeria graminis f. sp. hordei (strain DH14) TaxID=546991 RepID=N1JJZ2_BLUG1|nr:PDCD2/Programmed cell death protein 2 [Blumeria hordei DH14]
MLLDESDSSADEYSYTETNVLLGYASKEAHDPISHLGGQPQWIDPAMPPPVKFVRCEVCQDLMVLLLQLNADLPEYFPGHERRLYVWTCRRKTCKRKKGSIRVLRGVRTSKILVPAELENVNADAQSLMQSTQAVTDLGETLFGVNRAPGQTSNLSAANPFTLSASVSSSNPFSTTKCESSPGPPNIVIKDNESIPRLSKSFAELFTTSDDFTKPESPPSPETWPSDLKFPAAYPNFYLVDADYETLDAVTEASDQIRGLALDEGGPSCSRAEDANAFESTIDKTFQTFADRLAQNPEQVIRYEFGGQPLLYSKKDVVGKLLSSGGPDLAKVSLDSSLSNRIPRCALCKTERVFELQLTPQAIAELERGAYSIDDGMDWGTILIGVCRSNCIPHGVPSGEVGYVEEWAGVQWEELSERK